MSGPASVTPSKAQIFLRRLFSTLVLWAVILAAMFSNNHVISNGVFVLLIATLALAGLVEFYGMAEHAKLGLFQRHRTGRRGIADARHLCAFSRMAGD